MWRNAELITGNIQVLAELGLLTGLLYIIYTYSRLLEEDDGQQFSAVFLELMVTSNSFLILAVATSGFLLTFRKNTGWLGTTVTMGISTLLFVIIYFYDVDVARSYLTQNGEGTVVVKFDRNEFYLLISLISAMIFVVLISYNIRLRYKIRAVHWFMVVGTVAFLFADWFLTFGYLRNW